MEIKKLFALLAFGAVTSSAAPLFTLGTINPLTGSFFIGIEFNVSANTQVAQLGVIDVNNDSALLNDTIVALYSVPVGNSSKTATYITSATVLAGTLGTSIGVRRAFFVGITPFTLTPGNYFIGAGSGASGEGFGGVSTQTFLANTSYVNGWFAGSNTTFQGVGVNIQLTNQANGGGRWATALFDTAPASNPVPEPGTVTLLGLSLLGLAIRGRR